MRTDALVVPTSACNASVRFFLSHPKTGPELSCGRPVATLGQIELKFHHKNARIWFYQLTKQLARKRIFEGEKLIFVIFRGCP
jgi:hypothetical protein